MSQAKRREQYQYGTLQLEPRKRGPAVWVFRYLTIEDGRQKRPKIILGTTEELPTEKDAERACEHWRMAANTEHSSQPKPTMRGLTDRYIEEVLRPALDVALGEMQDESNPMSFHNAKSYRANINKYILPRWEEYLVDDFSRAETVAAIEQWLRSMIRSAKNPGGLAGNTVGGILNTLKQVFKFAVKWGYLAYNPVTEKRVELPRGARRRTKRPAQLTPQQFFLLMSKLDGIPKLAVVFAGWLGPRVSEAFGLKWEDVDLIAGVVNFRHGFVQGRFTRLKTEASRTNLPLPDDVLEEIRQWRQSTRYNRECDWIFASPRRKGKRPYWPNSMMKDHIQPVAVAAGLPKIGWHSFRHNTSAWSKQAGNTLDETKTLLRHSDIDMAAKVYGEIELEAKRDSQNRLVRYVKKQAEGWERLASKATVQ